MKLVGESVFCFKMLFLFFVHTPSLGSRPSFYDRAFGLLASPTFLEPPRVAGSDRESARLCDHHPIHDFCNWRGAANVTCLNGSSDVHGEVANRRVRVESRSIVHDGVGIALMWHSTTP